MVDEGRMVGEEYMPELYQAKHLRAVGSRMEAVVRVFLGRISRPAM
jgi:hypothetical protein